MQSGFAICFNIILVICVQIVIPADKKKSDPENASLVEVGPRFCLNPIKVGEG